MKHRVNNCPNRRCLSAKTVAVLNLYTVQESGAQS